MNDKLMSIFKLEQSLLQKVPFDYQLPNLLLGLQGKLLLQLLLAFSFGSRDLSSKFSAREQARW